MNKTNLLLFVIILVITPHVNADVHGWVDQTANKGLEKLSYGLYALAAAILISGLALAAAISKKDN